MEIFSLGFELALILASWHGESQHLCSCPAPRLLQPLCLLCTLGTFPWSQRLFILEQKQKPAEETWKATLAFCEGAHEDGHSIILNPQQESFRAVGGASGCWPQHHLYWHQHQAGTQPHTRAGLCTGLWLQLCPRGSHRKLFSSRDINQVV